MMTHYSSDTMINTFNGPYRWLSNFFPCSTLPPTLEHHYQAAKTDVPHWHYKIMMADTPQLAKRYGGLCPKMVNWDIVKDIIMLNLLRKKFEHVPLTQLLISTRDKMLVEGNHWHDNYWGVCYCGKCPPGKNKLGNL